MNISNRLILRLSQYNDALKKLKTLGFIKIFSDNIADAVGVTPSQVRKDFSIFGIPGNKPGGYFIDELIEELNKVLGKNINTNVIIAGVGNLALALIKYEIFRKEGIHIIAGFDNDPSKINESASIPIYHIDKMQDYIQSKNISVGILTVPYTSAQSIADIMATSGVKGILNFTTIKLQVKDDIIVTNINFQTELESLIYFVNIAKRSTTNS